jgi:hypothetical protein
MRTVKILPILQECSTYCTYPVFQAGAGLTCKLTVAYLRRVAVGVFRVTNTLHANCTTRRIALRNVEERWYAIGTAGLTSLQFAGPSSNKTKTNKPRGP